MFRVVGDEPREGTERTRRDRRRVRRGGRGGEMVGRVQERVNAWGVHGRMNT